MVKIDVLPDFPKSKGEILRFIAKGIAHLENQQHPILAQIKSFTQHEGRTLEYEQIEFGKKMQDAEEHSIPVEIRLDEVPNLFGEPLVAKMRSIAAKMGEMKMQLLFRKMDEATEQTGQRLDAHGKPLDAGMLLDMIDMGEVGFDKSGKPTSSFIVHPNMIPALKRVSDEVENDPELKRRLESINTRQRQQWIDRENRRKLVD